MEDASLAMVLWDLIWSMASARLLTASILVKTVVFRAVRDWWRELVAAASRLALCACSANLTNSWVLTVNATPKTFIVFHTTTEYVQVVARPSSFRAATRASR